MDLPFRVLTDAPQEPIISVDGAFGAPGLELSHWPGNKTPKELRHDLSTGSALLFSKLDDARKRELTAGCVAVANNHIDTDGVCAVFSVLRPDEALPRATKLLQAAEAGDFFRTPSEEAFVLDRIIAGLVEAERSPCDATPQRSDVERHAAAYDKLLELLPALLDGNIDAHRDLWSPALEDLHADREDMAAARTDDLVHLDLAVFTAPHDLRSKRTGGAFDPGRHALFGSTRRDRVLAVGPGAKGTTYRLVVSTCSWFDLDEKRQERPDLAALALRLEELERAAGETLEDVGWHAQAVNGASPELWFGTQGLESFAEHNPLLHPSRLSPAAVRREVIDAVRATWTFPDE